jgi:ferric-chelate reductase
MSFANFPLLWLFAGRNNIFLWASGWSFASFNIFHRHVARVATLQAVVHSLLYIIMFFQSESWIDKIATMAIILTTLQSTAGKAWRGLTKTYVLWGILVGIISSVWSHSSCELTLDQGTITMIILLTTTLDRIRIATYELFLIAHIMLSIITLVGCF